MTQNETSAMPEGLPKLNKTGHFRTVSGSLRCRSCPESLQTCYSAAEMVHVLRYGQVFRFRRNDGQTAYLYPYRTPYKRCTLPNDFGKSHARA